MEITWDPNKAEINFEKHKIRFSDAEMVLYDPFSMTLEDQVVSAERRFVTVGADATGRIVAVVYSYRKDTIRLISARKATSKERKQYEKRI
ncbi:MAG: BrnT family toxin [Proteobacteria bacterium]|nr:BrnT family toxin [Pseudomonadota bacterium]MBU4470493.1 BrnT family toxin [Pseudomonadota bacterium]